MPIDPRIVYTILTLMLGPFVALILLPRPTDEPESWLSRMLRAPYIVLQRMKDEPKAWFCCIILLSFGLKTASYWSYSLTAIMWITAGLVAWILAAWLIPILVAACKALDEDEGEEAW